jgi:hypothetical protein
MMKKVCFAELPVGSFFSFRGQRFKKLEGSLAGDSKSSRIIFDRDTEVEIVGNKETPATTDPPNTFNRPTIWAFR